LLRPEGLGASEIARRLGIGRASVYRWRTIPLRLAIFSPTWGASFSASCSNERGSSWQRKESGERRWVAVCTALSKSGHDVKGDMVVVMATIP